MTLYNTRLKAPSRVLLPLAVVGLLPVNTHNKHNQSSFPWSCPFPFFSFHWPFSSYHWSFFPSLGSLLPSLTNSSCCSLGPPFPLLGLFYPSLIPVLPFPGPFIPSLPPAEGTPRHQDTKTPKFRVRNYRRTKKHATIHIDYM